MIEPCFIGVDLGTSGCRALAVDGQGRQIGSSNTSLPAPLKPEPGHSEQDPAIWWRAVVAVLAELNPCLQEYQAQAIAVDGTSGSLLLCNPDDGTTMGHALMYDDQRSQDVLGRIQGAAPTSAAVHSATASLPKLVHLLGKLPGNTGRVLALHQAEWISGMLTGSFGMGDENNCLKLGYDPVARQWPAWMKQLHLPDQILPRVLPAGSPLGKLSQEAANLTGLPLDCMLMAGTTDSIAATLAAGISQPGEAVTSLGSTLVLKILTEQPLFAPEYGVYSHRIFDQWLAGGASNSGGQVLRQYFSDQEMAGLSKQLQPDQPTGLDYYPLTVPGERFPINDPTLAPRVSPVPKDRSAFFQALLEGMARIEKAGYERLQALGAPVPTHIFSCGGGSHNSAWTTIRRNISGIPISTAAHTEAAYGSALVAQRGFIASRQCVAAE